MDQDEQQTTDDSINRSDSFTRAEGKLSKAFMEFAELLGRRIAEKWGAQCDSSRGVQTGPSPRSMMKNDWAHFRFNYLRKGDLL